VVRSCWFRPAVAPLLVGLPAHTWRRFSCQTTLDFHRGKPRVDPQPDQIGRSTVAQQSQQSILDQLWNRLVVHLSTPPTSHRLTVASPLVSLVDCDNAHACLCWKTSLAEAKVSDPWYGGTLAPGCCPPQTAMSKRSIVLLLQGPSATCTR
jgi:hypothetical protein